jgi:hypothetical protein
MTSARWLLFGFSLLFAAVGSASRADAEDAAPVKPAAPALSADDTIARAAPAVVSLKFVLKWGDRERPFNAVGSVVDPSGLVVLSNDMFGDGQTKATGLKVLFGSDAKEWDAVIVARDSVLGLGWVQVLGLEKPVAAFDLSQGGAVRLGDDVRSVSRRGRGFDFAAVLGRHYVVSRGEKPRTMWGLAGDALSAGAVVLDLAGRPIGVTAEQSGSSGEEESDTTSFGSDATSGTFLIPLADARKSLEKARKKVPEAVEKAKTSSAEKPAEKPAEPAMGDEAAPKEPAAPGGMGETKPKEPTPGSPR